jgi:diguanylate cyclase (GGDEF)-like protein
MKAPNYTAKSRLKFVAKVTVYTCICVIGGIYFGFSPHWIGLPTNLGTLLVFGTLASVLIAVPITMWAGNQVRKNNAASRDLLRLSQTDQLSGAMSRAYLDTFMTESPNMSGIILMIDVDNFKAINDTHGHIIGDQAISKIGNVIKSNIREKDSFYRFGGEEFVVFLADTTPQIGHGIATRICESIANTPFIHNDKQFFVTVSIGGAIKREINPFKTTLAQADKNLYHVKQTGRNNVNFDDLTSIN